MAQSTSHESHTTEHDASSNTNDVNTTREVPTESQYIVDAEELVEEIVIKKARYNTGQ